LRDGARPWVRTRDAGTGEGGGGVLEGGGGVLEGGGGVLEGRRSRDGAGRETTRSRRRGRDGAGETAQGGETAREAAQ